MTEGATVLADGPEGPTISRSFGRKEARVFDPDTLELGLGLAAPVYALRQVDDDDTIESLEHALPAKFVF